MWKLSVKSGINFASFVNLLLFFFSQIKDADIKDDLTFCHFVVNYRKDTFDKYKNFFSMSFKIGLREKSGWCYSLPSWERKYLKSSYRYLHEQDLTELYQILFGFEMGFYTWLLLFLQFWGRGAQSGKQLFAAFCFPLYYLQIQSPAFPDNSDNSDNAVKK